MNTPLFVPGTQAYVRESAERGFLESLTITAVYSEGDQWVYTGGYGKKPPSTATFGDKITYRSPSTLYYNESELTTFCEAAAIARAALQSQIDKIDAQIAARC